jgi:hypothetical protein
MAVEIIIKPFEGDDKDSTGLTEKEYELLAPQLHAARCVASTHISDRRAAVSSQGSCVSTGGDIDATGGFCSQERLARQRHAKLEGSDSRLLCRRRCLSRDYRHVGRKASKPPTSTSSAAPTRPAPTSPKTKSSIGASYREESTQQDFGAPEL